MGPVRLCERNPRYAEYKGEPTVLVTSGEHYGAVLNLDFDYRAYLDALAADGLNLTRTFAGTYREVPGSFGIVNNVLATEPDKFICPWLRVEPAGGYLGGGVFDTDQWDEAYFDRLRDFVATAAERDIIVELVLFCYLYTDELWAYCPMNPANTAAGGAEVAIHEAYAEPESNPLIGLQDRLVRKIVAELNEFDNLYFEIINEPYSHHNHTAFDAWQWHIADTIVAAEAELPKRHLIAQNIQNRCMRVVDPHPGVSILNYHYAEPEAVTANYHLGRLIGDDETGFKGQAAAPYRFEAWRFMLAGGGAFSHLDYSFTTASPDGTAAIVGETPGYGGVEWRKQVAVLKRFIESFDFAAMTPHNHCVNIFTGALTRGISVSVLAEPGQAYAVYICGGGPHLAFGLGIPAGPYLAQWIHPLTGAIIREDTLDHPGGSLRLATPMYGEDIALRLVRKGE